MLDNAIEITCWSLPKHVHEAQTKCRTGVGVTDLAGALIMMCLLYDVPTARYFATQIGRCLRDNAYAALAVLACERGPHPLLSPERSLVSERFSAALSKVVCETIAKRGLRGSHLFSLVPTGSASLAFGSNCSNGVGPVLDWVYQRHMRIQHRAPQLYHIENHAYRLLRVLYGQRATLSGHFVTARQIDGLDRLHMVTALQLFADASISETILLPYSTSHAQAVVLLFHAWQLRLRSVMILRPDTGLDDVFSELSPLNGRSTCFC